MTDLTTNLRHVSDKLLYGSLDLLAPEWTVVKRAPCRWCSHRSPSRASLRAFSRRRIPGCTVQWSLRSGSFRWGWAHNLWEDSPRSKCLTPHSRMCAWDFSSNQPTWKMKMMMKIRRMKKKMRETVKSAEWRVEEYQNNNIMRMIHGWRARKTLEPMSRATLKCVLWNTRKCDVWECSVHTPVGCSRLLSAVNDLTTTIFWKNLVKKSTLSFLMSDLEEVRVARVLIEPSRFAQLCVWRPRFVSGICFKLLVPSSVRPSERICCQAYRLFDWRWQMVASLWQCLRTAEVQKISKTRTRDGIRPHTRNQKTSETAKKSMTERELDQCCLLHLHEFNSKTISVRTMSSYLNWGFQKQLSCE